MRLYNVIFGDFLFGPKNNKIIHKYIKKLVLMKRFETFSPKEIIDDFNINDIKWY